MIKENNMIILISLQKYRGKWTRSCGREKSIIDYIMIEEEDENGVENIIIDEKKEKSPYRMRRSDGIAHTIFPDHNVMISLMNWVQEEDNTQKKEKENSYDNKSGIHKVPRDPAKWESERNFGNVNMPTN